MRNVSENPRLPFSVADDQFRSQLWDILREYATSINEGADGRLAMHVSITGTYSSSVNDHTIFVAPTGTCTITVPAASQMIGKEIVIKRSNNTTHTITVQASAGNIDGSASTTMTTAYQVLRLRTDGSNFWTV